MDDGRTTEASHTISSPGAFGSGELKILIIDSKREFVGQCGTVFFHDKLRIMLMHLSMLEKILQRTK